MQDQLTSGQSNLQQQNSNLQQTQNNLQQNAGSSASSSDSSTLLSQPNTTELQVQDQGSPAANPPQTSLPSDGLSVLLLLLIISPVLIALAVIALVKRPNLQPEVAATGPPTEAEQIKPAASVKAKKKPAAKGKKKQSRSKRTSKK